MPPEEALEKAKAIAAKLAGRSAGGAATTSYVTNNHGNGNHPLPPTTVTTTSSPSPIALSTATTTRTGTKRSRWDQVSSSNNNNNDGNHGRTITSTANMMNAAASTASATAAAALAAALAAAASQKRAKTEAAAANANNSNASNNNEAVTEVSKRVWITTSPDRPALHYVHYLEQHIPAILKGYNPELEQIDDKNDQHHKGGKDNNNSDTKQSKSTLTKRMKNLDIQIKGRGSREPPPPPGMPLEPLHVWMMATSKLILDAAVRAIDALLDQAEQAVVSDEVWQLHEEQMAAEQQQQQHRNHIQGASSRLALTAGDPDQSLAVTQYKAAQAAGTSTYRPASVALMIGQVSGGRDGSFDNNNTHLTGGSGDTTTWLEEQMQVPSGVVGYLIGRGGETVCSLQARTGCKVQMDKDNGINSKAATRTLTLAATTQESLDQCRELIEQMVASRIQAMGGNVANSSGGGIGGAAGVAGTADSNKDSKVQEAIAAGHAHVEMQVPDADVGLIIGRQGATIRQIQDATGASIQLPPPLDGKNGASAGSTRTVHITHPTPEGVAAAQARIQDLLHRSTSQNHHPQQGRFPQQAAAPAPVPQNATIQVAIPDSDVGLCIGRQGCVIRYMQDCTGTRIQIPHAVAAPGDTHRIAVVTGPVDGCEHVRAMMARISAEQSAAAIMAAASYQGQQQHHHHPHYGAAAGGFVSQQAGGYYANQYPGYGYGTAPDAAYHAQQQQTQQTGDYSPEWAAYHAAQQAAAAQQQQQQATAEVEAAPVAVAAETTTTAATTASTTTAANTYYEQFFRYAYYYGEEAARIYYGAWSPPVGTPNPYGTNPAGIQPAPSAATTPTTTTAAATASDVASTTAATTVEAAAASTAVTAIAEAPIDLTDAAAKETSRRKVSNLPAWMTNKS